MIALGFVMVVVLAVAAVLGAPLYSSALAGRRERRAAPADNRVELEADRDAKLREIRDTELDWRTGKLSEADWQELDGRLRAEAAEILSKLDALDVKSGSAR